MWKVGRRMPVNAVDAAHEKALLDQGFQTEEPGDPPPPPTAEEVRDQWEGLYNAVKSQNATLQQTSEHDKNVAQAATERTALVQGLLDKANGKVDSLTAALAAKTATEEQLKSALADVLAKTAEIDALKKSLADKEAEAAVVAAPEPSSKKGK
jgi:hypothetical protein